MSQKTQGATRIGWGLCFRTARKCPSVVWQGHLKDGTWVTLAKVYTWPQYSLDSEPPQLAWVPFPSALHFALINVKAYFTNQGDCYTVEQRGSRSAGSHHRSQSKGSLPPQPCQGMCVHHGFQHMDASSQSSQIPLIDETTQPESLLCWVFLKNTVFNF